MAFKLAEAFVELSARGATGVGRTLGRVTSQFRTMGTVAAGAVATASAALGGLSIGKSLQLAASAEQTAVSFKVLLGSVEKANDVLAQLEQFAATTPFQQADLNDAARKLIAFNTPAEEVVNTLRNIGDISAGISAPIGEIAEIFGKARVQGRLFQEDINQLTGRGIPIIQELSKQFGVTDAEIRKLVSSGRVNFGNLQQAFISLTAEGGKFSGLMAAQSQTLAGRWSTFKDNVTLNLKDVGLALSDAFDLKGVLESVTNFAARVRGAIPVLQQFLATNKEQILQWVKLGGVLVGIPVAVTAIVTVFATLLSPIGIALGLIVALGAAFVAFNGTAGDLDSNLAEFGDKFLTTLEEIRDAWFDIQDAISDAIVKNAEFNSPSRAALRNTSGEELKRRLQISQANMEELKRLDIVSAENVGRFFRAKDIVFSKTLKETEISTRISSLTGELNRREVNRLNKGKRRRGLSPIPQQDFSVSENLFARNAKRGRFRDGTLNPLKQQIAGFLDRFKIDIPKIKLPKFKLPESKLPKFKLPETATATVSRQSDRFGFAQLSQNIQQAALSKQKDKLQQDALNEAKKQTQHQQNMVEALTEKGIRLSEAPIPVFAS